MPAAVLIVNYRVYEHLNRALQSLARFLRAGDEVVVVDNASDPARLRDLASAHPSVRFIPVARNLGFAAAINLAARESRAPFLLWLNPDTEVTEPVLDVLEAWLRDHADTAVVGPRVLTSDGDQDGSARGFPGLSTLVAGRSSWLTRRFPGNWLSRRNLPAQDATGPTAVDWLAGSCLMTRREIFERLRGLDERFFLYWEDADFCRRVSAAGWRCVYLPSVSVRHAGGLSSATDRPPAIRAFHRSAFRFYWKHSGLWGRVVAPLAAAGLWATGEWRVRRARAGR